MCKKNEDGTLTKLPTMETWTIGILAWPFYPLLCFWEILTHVFKKQDIVYVKEKDYYKTMMEQC